MKIDIGSGRAQKKIWGAVLTLLCGCGLSISALAQSTVQYIHTDALGSPVAITDSAGNLVERNAFDPYGQSLGQAPMDAPGFTGHMSDSATSLTYMEQRYYDPQISKFLSVDPVTTFSNPTGAFNRYWYANNNPQRFIDLDGRAAKDAPKPPPPPVPTLPAVQATAPPIQDMAGMTVTAPRMEPLARPISWPSITIGISSTASAWLAAPLLFFASPDPCGYRCGELNATLSKIPDVPSVGPPGQWIDGRRRSRLYGPDGRPKVDIDNPHQGADYPHVHDWVDGVREHPGREIPDTPTQESDTKGD